MIANSVYNLGDVITTNTNLDDIYSKENGSYVEGDNPIKTTNSNMKIALMYTSDYGYSVDSRCTENPIDYNVNDLCKESGTWLYKGVNEWTLSPRSTTFASYINQSGSLLYTFAYSGREVRPTLYLRPTVFIESGEGTSGNPYILNM